MRMELSPLLATTMELWAESWAMPMGQSSLVASPSMVRNGAWSSLAFAEKMATDGGRNSPPSSAASDLGDSDLLDSDLTVSSFADSHFADRAPGAHPAPVL